MWGGMQGRGVTSAGQTLPHQVLHMQGWVNECLMHLYKPSVPVTYCTSWFCWVRSCWPWNNILIQKFNPTKMLIQEHVTLGKIRFCVAYIGDIQCHEAKRWMKQWCKLESWYVRNIERQNVLIFRKGVVYTGLLLLSNNMSRSYITMHKIKRKA